MNRFLKKAAMPLLLFVAVILFCVDNPFTAFFLYVPLFFIMERSSPKQGLFSGAVYGLFSYMFYLDWLFTFNSTAFFCVCFLYTFYFAFVFFIGCRIFDIFGKIGAFCFAPFFCACEFIRTTGFLGFSYGIAAYSLWKTPCLIQSADLFGVWGVEFLLLYSSASVYFVISYLGSDRSSFLKKSVLISSGIFFLLFFINLIYGGVKLGSVLNFSQDHEVTVCAVQNNSDPWNGDFEHYRSDVECLMNFTDQALSENPGIDFVVWPETSVVPSILQNFYDGNEAQRKNLIRSLLEYIDSKDAVFVIGNYNPVGKNDEQKDYNSAFVFIPKKNVLPPEPLVYSKNHLVPFGEYFPYDKEFPFINDFLFENDRQWTRGDELTVFDLDGIKFSTPICFEDGFGSDCAEFVRNGAELLFNMSNDAWAKSAKCQIQHLSMSVFRSIENRIPVIRSTSSGETCIINNQGIVQSSCNSFEKSFVVGKVFLKKMDNTLYTNVPDLLAYVFVAVSIVLVVFIFVSKLAIGSQIR